MENPILDLIEIFGVERLLVAIAAGTVASIIKRKIKLNAKRDLVVRVAIAFTVAAILAAVFASGYDGLVSVASGGLGLSYVISGLAAKDAATAEIFLRTVAPDLSEEDVRGALKGKSRTEEIYEAIRPLVEKEMPDERIKLVSQVISVLKKFDP